MKKKSGLPHKIQNIHRFPYLSSIKESLNMHFILSAINKIHSLLMKSLLTLETKHATGNCKEQNCLPGF